MQKFANFVSLTRIPGSTSLKQGVKGGKIPKNTVAGGNGTFITYDRAEVILTLEYKGKRYSKDIYYDIKDATGGRKITDKFCSKLEDALETFEFTVEDGKFTNIDEAIEYAVGL